MFYLIHPISDFLKNACHAVITLVEGRTVAVACHQTLARGSIFSKNESGNYSNSKIPVLYAGNFEKGKCQHTNEFLFFLVFNRLLVLDIFWGVRDKQLILTGVILMCSLQFLGKRCIPYFMARPLMAMQYDIRRRRVKIL